MSDFITPLVWLSLGHPFLTQNDYGAFLPAREQGGGKRIRDVWELLSALYARPNDRTAQSLHKDGGRLFVRVKVYGKGRSGAEVQKMHDIPLLDPELPHVLLLTRDLTERAYGDWTDYNELFLTDRGRATLARYLRIEYAVLKRDFHGTASHA